jgi:hypothetical protein
MLVIGPDDFGLSGGRCSTLARGPGHYLGGTVN